MRRCERRHPTPHAAMRRQASARRHTHRPKALPKCKRCRNDGRNAAIDMHTHAANETNIADIFKPYYRVQYMRENVRALIRITEFDGRTYHRADYRVKSLVRTSASTTANNSASNCADDTNTGSGDRSASPPMGAGVRVLARVLSRKCQSDRAIRAMPEYAAAIGIHA